MKALALILALSVFYLSAKPGIDLVISPLQSLFDAGCCSDQCTLVTDLEDVATQTPEGTCNGDSCNPFQACCSCFFLCQAINLDKAPKSETEIKQKFTYQIAYSFPFTSDFWQPPKMV